MGIFSLTVFQGVPVNIADHLYLGSAAHASQLELLERLGITALLNVSPNCPNYWPDKFEYQTIPVEDNSTADIKALVTHTTHGAQRALFHNKRAITVF